MVWKDEANPRRCHATLAPEGYHPLLGLVYTTISRWIAVRGEQIHLTCF